MTTKKQAHQISNRLAVMPRETQRALYAETIQATLDKLPEGERNQILTIAQQVIEELQRRRGGKPVQMSVYTVCELFMAVRGWQIRNGA